MQTGPWGNQVWRMPPDRSWIAVKIISAEVVDDYRTVIGPDGRTPEERVVKSFKITSQRANSDFGERPKPYVQYVPVHEIVVPYANPRDDRYGYTVGSDDLLRATGIQNCIGKLEKICLDVLCGTMREQIVLVDVFHDVHDGLVFDHLDNSAFRAVPD